MAESYAGVKEAVVVVPGAGRSGEERNGGPTVPTQFAPMGEDEAMDE